MEKEKVIIFGEGNIQELAFFYLENDGRWEVVAFTADANYIHSDTWLGRPMVPFENIELVYPPAEYKMFVPLGYKRNNHLRAEKYRQAKAKGYGFVTYISPHATYYGTPVGENCFIFENNVIQPFTTIGDDTILWSGNHIGHHTKIGSHVFIASHVVVSGIVEVGDYTFIGVNATVGNGLKIGEDNLIGAGAVITKDTSEGEVYVPNRSILLEKKSSQISIDKPRI